MEKAGQSDVRRLPVLSETKIFGAAIQDSGSQLKRKVGRMGGGGDGVGRGEGFGSGKVAVVVGEEVGGKYTDLQM